MRATLDVDTLVAGTLADSGAASDLLSFWRKGFFDLIASEKLIEEFSEVLGRPRISSRYGITAIDVQDLATEIRTEGRLYPDPAKPPRYVPDDPDDDYVVALALAARADALVTRDRHIHSARIVGLRVMYPGKFRNLLSESNPP